MSFSSNLIKTIENEEGDEDIAFRIQPEPMNTKTTTIKPIVNKKPSVIWGSNFNHVMSKRSSSENLTLNNKNDIIGEESAELVAAAAAAVTNEVNSKRRVQTARPNVINKPKPMDIHTARILTLKSFLIEPKDLLQNYIEYNGLFAGKEKMAADIVVTAPVQHVETRKPSLKQITNYEIMNTRPRTVTGVKYTGMDWKQSMPSIYYTLECYMSPNYRETIRPPVSTKVKTPSIDYLEFKAKLKRNSLQQQQQRVSRRSSSSITHLNEPIAVASTSSESGDTAGSSRMSLRRNSMLNVGGGKKKNSVDLLLSTSSHTTGSSSSQKLTTKNMLQTFLS